MTGRWSRIVGTLFCGISTVAGFAAAEEVWVLWLRSPDGTYKSWCRTNPPGMPGGPRQVDLAPGESLRCLPKTVDPRESMDPRGPKGKRWMTVSASTAWWDEPAYKPCNTLHLRGVFILRKLQEHDPARFHDVTDFYGDDRPDPQDIGKFEWQVILAYMGASDVEITDVQKRMGRVRR
jgi:hypothetical protein